MGQLNAPAGFAEKAAAKIAATGRQIDVKSTIVRSCSRSDIARLFATDSYSSHCKPKPSTALRRPIIKPSYTNGQRMKLFVAPTIFIMAISSRRSNVVSLMVFEMMKTDTSSKIAMSAMHTTLATFRSVIKPPAMSSSTRTLATPSTLSKISCAVLPEMLKSST